MNQEEPTIKDVFEAITVFSDNTDQRFKSIDTRFDNLDKRVVGVESRVVTKDYLDDKLADLQGEMVGLMRRLCPWGFEKQPIK